VWTARRPPVLGGTPPSVPPELLESPRREEIKRRTRVMRIFPNEESCLRLVSALCVETSEEWMTGRRFLGMDALREMLEAEREEGARLIAVS